MSLLLQNNYIHIKREDYIFFWNSSEQPITQKDIELQMLDIPPIIILERPFQVRICCSFAHMDITMLMLLSMILKFWDGFAFILNKGLISWKVLLLNPSIVTLWWMYCGFTCKWYHQPICFYPSMELFLMQCPITFPCNHYGRMSSDESPWWEKSMDVIYMMG